MRKQNLRRDLRADKEAARYEQVDAVVNKTVAYTGVSEMLYLSSVSGIINKVCL